MINGFHTDRHVRHLTIVAADMLNEIKLRVGRAANQDFSGTLQLKIVRSCRIDISFESGHDVVYFALNRVAGEYEDYI